MCARAAGAEDTDKHWEGIPEGDGWANSLALQVARLDLRAAFLGGWGTARPARLCTSP